ncbi:hypothetical protein BH09PAT3_BH09PAT3_3900 [soil metagenome]
MSTVFAILFLASIGFLVWGVVSPASLSKHSKKPVTRRDAGIGFGVIAFVMLVLTGVTVPDTASKQSTETSNVKPAISQSTAAPVAPEPVISTETITETQPIPFSKTTVNDSTRTKGTSVITRNGVDGVKTLTYEVKKTDGVETARKVIKEDTTTLPVNEVTSIGTKVAVTPKVTPAPAASSNCDPNYSGACVPVASDVDCGSGSGNGPAYVYGVVTVIGTDIYGLDANHNGLGCE